MKHSEADITYLPLVSIVILNWDMGELIQNCLQHVFDQTYANLEVIVVDNGSSDGSTDKVVRRWGDRISFIRNHQNLGFAQGMNQGITHSTGKYLLLLNADMYLEPTFIERTVVAMEQLAGNRIGMLGAISRVYRDGRKTDEIDMAGVLLGRCHIWAMSSNIVDPQFVLGPAGSAMFVSRAMLEDIRLPEGDYLVSSYFAYGEDIELFLRSQLMGWRCLFQPWVAGWHVGSGAVKGEKSFMNKPDFFQVHAIKNRFANILTCYPFTLWLWTLPWNLLLDMGTAGSALFTGRWRLLYNWCHAVGITLRTLPQLLRRRRWLMKRRRVSNVYLRSLYIKQSIRETLLDLAHKARPNHNNG